MQISSEKPLVWEGANELFQLEKNKIAAVFTYGNTIYNPFNCPLTPELIRHEETHMLQQQGSSEVAKIWWQNFLQDPQFRIEQEAEAYGAQYKLHCQMEKNKRKQYMYLARLADMLAGPMYGYSVPYLEAAQKIKEFADGGYGDE